MGEAAVHVIAPRWHPVRSANQTFEVPAPRTVSVDGADICVRDGGGPGYPLLLIHGWGADGLLNYGPTFAPLYRAGWRPISVDLPGHGGSRDPERVSIERCAEVVSGALRQLRVPTAVVVGYSLGGPVSQMLTRSHPEQVAGLVQMATGARNLPAEVLRPGARLGALLASQGIRFGHRTLRHGTAPAVGDGDHSSMFQHALWVARTMGYSDLAALGMELAAYDSRRWVGQLGVPAHCVLTIGDRVVPGNVQEELSDLLGASTTSIAGGHLACMKNHFAADIVIAAASVRAHRAALAA